MTCMMTNQNKLLPTDLYTAEAAESAEQAKVDGEVPDPEDGAQAIAKLLDPTRRRKVDTPPTAS